MSELENLRRQIKKILFSIDSLDKSFIRDHIEKKANEPQIAVNLDHFRNLFRKINNTKRDEMRQLFARKFHEISITFLSYHSEREEKMEMFLNVFIIGMETIHFFEMPIWKATRGNIMLAIGYLPLKAQTILIKYWKNLDAEWFKKAIDEIKYILRNVCLSNSFDYDNDRNVMLILKGIYSILYFANIDDDQQIDEITSKSTIKSLENILPWFRIRRSPKIPLNEFHTITENYFRYLDWNIFEFSVYPEQISYLHFAFALTPELKYEILERLISKSKDTSQILEMRVERNRLLPMIMKKLEEEGFKDWFRCPVRVQFVGELANDVGGVAREFFRLLFEEIFDPETKLFFFTPGRQYSWFNCKYGNVRKFYCVGILMGIAFLNEIQIHIPLPKVFFYKLLDRPGNFYDLFDFDQTLALSLSNVLQYEKDDLEDVFMMNFEAVINDSLYELVPGGSRILVTQTNKVEYVKKYADMILNRSVEEQFSWLKRGFFKVITEKSVQGHLRNAEDLRLFMCGEDFIDVDVLQSMTSYEDYTEHSSTILMFWNVLREFSQQQLKTFLIFISGSDRIPAGGLDITIQRSGPDSELLPFAITCTDTLCLPEYSTKNKLKERLLLALSYHSGFGAL